ncbi:MAG TPA: CdaR family protein [Candidatus Deferrimicrobiaceae bacterium]
MLDFLRGVVGKNLGLKALALGLAIALWWFVAGESKVQVGFVVPLEIRNVPAGMTITNKIDRQVEVRLSGPPYLLGTLQPAEISAAIDLSNARPGRQVLHMNDSSIKVPPGIKVQRVYPNAIEVSLERLERRRVPLYVKLLGNTESRRRITKIEIVPPSMEVEALPDEFSRLESLPVPVSIPENASESLAENARVELREGHARIVGNPVVRVTIYFRK